MGDPPRELSGGGLVTDSIWYLAAALVPRAFGLLTLPIMTRHLSTEEIGSLEIYLLILSVLVILLPMEVPAALGPLLGRLPLTEHPSAISTAMALVVVGLVIGLVGLAILAIAGETCWALTTAPWMVALLGIAASAGILAGFVQYLLRWQIDARGYALSIMLSALVAAVASVGLLVLTTYRIEAILAGAIIGNLAGFACGWRVLPRMQAGLVSARHGQTLIVTGAPLALSSLVAIAASQVDRWLLVGASDLSTVGQYSIAMRLAPLAALPMAIAQQAVLGRIYADQQNPAMQRTLASLVQGVGSLVLWIWAALALFADSLIVVVAGPNYSQAATLLPILTLAVIAIQFAGFSPGPVIAGRTGIVVLANLVSIILAAGLGWCWLPYHGATGVAWAAVVGGSTGSAIHLVLGQSYYPVDWPWQRLALGLLAAIGAVALGSAEGWLAIPALIGLALVLGVLGGGSGVWSWWKARVGWADRL